MSHLETESNNSVSGNMIDNNDSKPPTKFKVLSDFSFLSHLVLRYFQPDSRLVVITAKQSLLETSTGAMCYREVWHQRLGHYSLLHDINLLSRESYCCQQVQSSTMLMAEGIRRPSEFNWYISPAPHNYVKADIPGHMWKSPVIIIRESEL